MAKSIGGRFLFSAPVHPLQFVPSGLPATSSSRSLCGFLEEVLDVSPVGADDDFFCSAVTPFLRSG